MKRGITREYGQNGRVVYWSDDVVIKGYEEDLHCWLSTKFTHIREFLTMIIEREIEKDPDNECTELYMAVDFVDGIARQALDRVEYIYDRLGLSSLDVIQSPDYNPGIVLKDEMFDAVVNLGGFSKNHFPNIAGEPFPKIILFNGSGPGKEAFVKMLIQHCDWLGVPHAVITENGEPIADHLMEYRSFRGIVFIIVTDNDGAIPPGVFPWQVIEFRHTIQTGTESV